jgi:hypothetical protein
MRGLRHMEGYIKISRAILNHPALNKRDRTYCEVGAWLWILLEASFAERDFTIGTQTVRLQRGEFCHSISYMAEAWGWSHPKTRHYIDKLVKFNSILLVKPDGKSADFPNIVKVLNYDDYQDALSKSDGKPHGNKHKQLNNKIINIDEFNNLWRRLTAKRGSKKVAYQKWIKVKDKVSVNELVESYNCLVKKASSIEFIPHFSTFLSQERWLDEDKIVKEKAITPEQFFRKRFPNTVPDGYLMVAHSWKEITFSNGKQQITYDYKTGKQI